MGQAIFVTGTDTGVGKTVVAAALVLAARRLGVDAGVMKPVSCGLEPGETESADTRFLREATASHDSPVDITPVTLKAFRAPEVATRLENRPPLESKAIVEAVVRARTRHEALVVEGVGGLRVPIAPGYEVRDWIYELKMPVLIVARSGLGTLNHTGLTAEALAARGISALGFLLNDGTSPCEDALAEENAQAVTAMTGLPCLGRVRPDPLVRSGRRALSPATVAALERAASCWLGRSKAREAV